MKRKIILFVSLLMCISILSACSTAPTADSIYTDNSAPSVNSTITDRSVPLPSPSPTPVPEKPYKAGLLCRADFEIPDCRGLGYTNMIDFYNNYPDGKSGGTFANAGLMVHYPGDLDKDISDSESIAFRTYRGIGLGSTLEEVFTEYGKVTFSPPNEWEIGISTPEHTLKGSVIYLGRTDSGAYVTIRFYFDQNDTVMFISYDAIYSMYANGVSYPEAFNIV